MTPRSLRPKIPAGRLAARLSHPVVLALLLLAALAAAYHPVLKYGFISFDDNIHIYDNRQMDGSAANILHFWKEPHERLYIPLTYTLWSLQARAALTSPNQEGAGRFDPAPFHAVNLVVHAGNCLLVLSLLRALGLAGPAALLGALLFGLHPLQVESAAWISEFKGLLAAFFVLAALRLHLAAVATATETAKKPPAAKGDDPPWNPRSGTAAPARAGAAVPQSRGSGGNYSPRPPEALRPCLGRRGRLLRWAALGCLVLALLSKPSSAVAPFLLLILDLAVLRLPWRRVVAEAGLWLLAVVPFAVVAKVAQPDSYLATVPPLFLRPVVYLDALAFYLGKLVLPIDLCVDYGRTPVVLLQSWEAWVTWLVPVAVAVLVWRLKGARWLAGPYLLFCAGFLPVSGLVPFAFQRISTVADRYAYLPMLGAALGCAMAWAGTRSRAVKAALVLAVAVMAGATVHQSGFWRDNIALYEHTLPQTPNSAVAVANYGVALFEAGRLADAVETMERAHANDPGALEVLFDLGVCNIFLGRLDVAKERFSEVLSVPGNRYSSKACLGIGHILNAQGKPQEAEQYFADAARLDPTIPSHRYVHANCLADLGRNEEAVAEYRETLRLWPGHIKARLGLATSLFLLGRLNEALAEYGETVRLDPNCVEARMSMGNILAAMGRKDEAAAQYREVLRINPGFADVAAQLAALGPVSPTPPVTAASTAP